MEDAEDLRRGEEKRQKQTERHLEREKLLRAQGELLPLTEGERESARRSGGENTREVSWIWRGTGTEGSDAELRDAVRIEWSKVYARVRRWREEMRLLEEEAQHLPISLEFEATEWEGRVRMVRVRTVVYKDTEGAIAYRIKQAAMYREIAARVLVTMTELRMGRGKRRKRIQPLDEMDVDAGAEEEDNIGVDSDEEELEDLRGNDTDDEHLLAGGADDD
ncbi:hypothetical protein B0H16DRAFT_1707886 [Mycena metata]|uniref:Uncharacterized protein n=1 Tax=Mycena metata TaxID=1033252 RepID=A0AAD7KH19_9AGAR|nr:hypothetical protein B0H16DRAFT_1707886 [Mycena metata]